MTSASLQTTSRVWSCSTLNDGIDHLLMEANKIETEEEQLEKWIQDPGCFLFMFSLWLDPNKTTFEKLMGKHCLVFQLSK